MSIFVHKFEQTEFTCLVPHALRMRTGSQLIFCRFSFLHPMHCRPAFMPRVTGLDAVVVRHPPPTHRRVRLDC